MRKGMRPSLLLDPSGEIFAIATGSDATSEHEHGAKPLMLELTGEEPRYVAATATALRRQGSRKVPSVMDGRKLCRDLDSIVFQQGDEDGEPVAAVGYSSRGNTLDLLGYSELSLSRYSDHKDMAGAWDEFSFGFKARGATLVEKLKRFHQSLQEGKGMFAGMFLTGEKHTHLGGIILCDSSKLRPEHRAAIEAAQAVFEEAVGLELDSRAADLYALAKNGPNGTHLPFGYVKAFKRDPDTGEVMYWFNPDSVHRDNYGMHSFEALANWLRAGAKGPIQEKVSRPA